MMPNTAPGYPQNYLRADLADFAGYSSARTSAPRLASSGTGPGLVLADAEDQSSGDTLRPWVWLNANEAAEANSADADGTVRRYPDPQPSALRERLAELWGARAPETLVVRGSDEGIDLLVRAACPPGSGAVVVTPPTFGMYAVSARLHGVRALEAPQIEVADSCASQARPRFTIRAEEVVSVALAGEAQVVFLTSPGNPTGGLIDSHEIQTIAGRLRGRCLVVIDEAYGDFAQMGGEPSAVELLNRHENLVVLRTLSKAHGLAGARVGAVMARQELIAVLGRVQAPYPLAIPATELALRATQPQALAATRDRVARTVSQRHRLATALAEMADPKSPVGVRSVLCGSANFVTLRVGDPRGLHDALTRQGIVVRALDHPGLTDALRITVGTPTQNHQVIATVREASAAQTASRAPTDAATLPTQEKL